MLLGEYSGTREKPEEKKNLLAQPKVMIVHIHILVLSSFLCPSSLLLNKLEFWALCLSILWWLCCTNSPVCTYVSIFLDCFHRSFSVFTYSIRELGLLSLQSGSEASCSVT